MTALLTALALSNARTPALGPKRPHTTHTVPMKHAKTPLDERRQLLAYLEQSLESAAECGAEFDATAFIASAEAGDHILDPTERPGVFAIVDQLVIDPTIYRDAINTWGESDQALMLVEECGELLSVFGKRTRLRSSDAEVASEVADVFVMLVQFAEMVGVQLVVNELDLKLGRLRTLIEAHNEIPTSTCPNCGAEVPDFDGFGVLAHDECGYCSHPSMTDGCCGICGGTDKRDRSWGSMGTVEPSKVR